MARLITQSQFARKKKVDRSTVCRWVKEGKIRLTAEGRIDPIQAEKDLTANVSPRDIDSTKRIRKHRKKKPPPNSTTNVGLLNGEPTLTDARRQTELLKGELLALKLQVERGELVSRGEVLRWLIALVVAVRLAFQSMPKRIAPVLKLLDDEKSIEIELRKEIYSIIRKLVKDGRSEQIKEAQGAEGEGAGRSLVGVGSRSVA